jgi:hypothetical protein
MKTYDRIGRFSGHFPPLEQEEIKYKKRLNKSKRSRP